MSTKIGVVATKEVSNYAQLMQMKALLEKFTHLMHKNDLSIRPYSEASMALLKTFQPERIDGIRQHFEAFHKVCEQLAQDNVQLRDNISFVKFGLKYLNLNVPSTFFNFVAADDLIEIYDLSNIQIFRNLRFFEITNYTLGDLLTFPWSELYERSSMIMDKMAEGAATILRGDDVISPLNVPIHLIKEIRTNPVQVCEVRFKFISPVYDEAGNKAGVIVNCQAQSLNNKIPPQGLDFI